MPHFEPQIVFGQWIEVTGPGGTEWVEADLVGPVEEYRNPCHTEESEGSVGYRYERTAIPVPEQLQLFIENTTAWEIKLVEGWGGRLSSPGHLDATPWTVFETEEETSAYLEDEQTDE